MESGAIPDSDITASSSHRDFAPYQGRLNGVAGHGAWAARANEIGQWLQVDLGEIKRVTGTVIQGRRTTDYRDQFVTSYKLQYRAVWNSWTTYTSSDGSDKVFTGNTNALSPVTNLLDNPVNASHVRFVVQSWHTHICMRVEVLVCSTVFCSSKHVANGTLTWDLPGVKSSPFIFEVKVNTSGSGSGLIYLYRWGDNTTENQDGYRVELRCGQSQIARTTNDTGRDTVANNYSTDITSAEEFRRFWICWSKGGSVGVGRAGEVEPFMSWTDPHPVTDIGKVGYGTWDVPGYFMFHCTRASVAPACPRLLGMESGDIADGSITASSFHREASYTYGLEPRYGRLNAAPTRAWTAGYNFVGQWFQVDLGKMKLVMGTIIQGRLDHEERHWVFPGNVDMSIPVTNLLDNPVDARHVRFVVQSWNNHISMRVEIVGCNTTAVAPVCPYLLGMESGAIPDGSITASSFHRESSSSYGLEPRYGRLNVAPTRAWTAKYNLVGQWLQVFPGNVDMSLPVTNLLDSPVDARYVRFVVLSWNDRIAMRVEIVFPGNVDVSLPVTNLLNNPVVARYVRFVVQSWHNRIAMRVEIVGCNTNSL
ncbi:lactadherin-like [Branchiostoma floridae]|uniref:Lactadherin-like n=1 Tax=Branchiostoma floridae TaxID=7739 RepID=A0A9J7KRF3_BRAFL|nr:lactadherin-like [Branchiostoma floridae]